MPYLPGDHVTIVAGHLENRTTPKGRVKQMDEILDLIKPISHPVIVAGDMNTTGSDGSVVVSMLFRDLTTMSLHSNHGLVYLNSGQSYA